MLALAVTGLAAWAPPALASGPDGDAEKAVAAASKASVVGVGPEADGVNFGATVDVAAGTTADSAVVQVTAPADAAAPITLKARSDDLGAEVAIALPTSVSASDAQVVNGDAVYVNTAKDITFVVDAKGDGARILSVLGSPAANHVISYDVAVPRGADLIEQPDGSVDIVASVDGASLVLGTIGSPWALDARGNTVKTHYMLIGSNLSQVVEPTDQTAYPVTADPSISLGWYIYIRYSRSDVQRYWSGTGVANLAVASVTCALVGKYAGAYVGSVCGALYGAWISNWNGTFADAKRLNQCVEVRMLYTGAPVDARRYSC